MAKPSLIITGSLHETFSSSERLVLILQAMARQDEAEVHRLWRSCPRQVYSMVDAEVHDRFSMLFDIVALLGGDLQAGVAQIRTVNWAMVVLEHFAPLANITATLGFVDGARCVRGLPQSPFFSRTLRGIEEQMKEAQAIADDEEDHAGAEQEDEEQAVEPEEQGEELAEKEDDDAPPDPEELHESERLDAVQRHAAFVSEQMKVVLTKAGEGMAAELKGVWEALDRFCQDQLGLSGMRVLEACGLPVREELAAVLKLYADVHADQETVAGYREVLERVWKQVTGAY